MKQSYLFLSCLFALVVGCTGNGRNPNTPTDVVKTFVIAWKAGTAR